MGSMLVSIAPEHINPEPGAPDPGLFRIHLEIITWPNPANDCCAALLIGILDIKSKLELLRLVISALIRPVNFF